MRRFLLPPQINSNETYCQRLTTDRPLYLLVRLEFFFCFFLGIAHLFLVEFSILTRSLAIAFCSYSHSFRLSFVFWLNDVSSLSFVSCNWLCLFVLASYFHIKFVFSLSFFFSYRIFSFILAFLLYMIYLISSPFFLSISHTLPLSSRNIISYSIVFYVFTRAQCLCIHLQSKQNVNAPSFIALTQLNKCVRTLHNHKTHNYCLRCYFFYSKHRYILELCKSRFKLTHWLIFRKCRKKHLTEKWAKNVVR